MTTMTC